MELLQTVRYAGRVACIKRGCIHAPESCRYRAGNRLQALRPRCVEDAETGAADQQPTGTGGRICATASAFCHLCRVQIGAAREASPRENRGLLSPGCGPLGKQLGTCAFAENVRATTTNNTTYFWSFNLSLPELRAAALKQDGIQRTRAGWRYL